MESKELNENITFRLEESDDFRLVKGRLLNIFSAEMMSEIRKYSLSLFADRKVVFLNGEGEPCHTDLLTSLKEEKQSQESVLLFITVILYDKDNLKTYLHLLPEDVNGMLRKVLRNVYVRQEDMEKIMGHTVLGGSIFRRYGLDECSWLHSESFPTFKNSGKDGGPVDFFYLYPSIYASVFSEFYPETNNERQISELPEEESLRTANFEKETFLDVNTVKKNYQQGLYEAKTTKLIPSSIRKELQQLKFKEFEFSALTDDVTYMRAQFIVSGVAMIQAAYPKIVQMENILIQDFVKAMVDKLPYHKEWTFDMFLPYLSGIKVKDLESCTVSRLLLRINQYLQTSVNGEWMSKELLDQHLYKTINDYRVPLTLIPIPKIANRHYIFNKFTMVAVNADRQVRQMGLAFAHSYILYLASLGCMEVAYRDANRQDDSPYEGLAYFRLTALGHYAFGLTEEYTPPAVEFDQTYFELDDKRLIVRSVVEDNPYLHVVEDIAVPLCGGRYEITTSSFLIHCSSEKDVEYHISMFRQYVTSDLPEIWTDFFERIRKHCKPLKTCMAQQFRIYQIDSENKELVHLLMTDEVLHTCLLRSENYYIMVKSSCQEQFERRMRELGYLL